jgi:hypothetical protein
MVRYRIPNPVIAVVAEVLGGHYYNHTRLNTLFAEAGAPGEAPPGNCVTKCEQWLKASNLNPGVEPLAVLGKVLETFMELPYVPRPWETSPPAEDPERTRVEKILAKYGLVYVTGGHVRTIGSSPASATLKAKLHGLDLPGVEEEFKRALDAVESDPPAGVTAACAILESLFKSYIAEVGISAPGKQTIGELYKAVRGHLKLDPAGVADQELKKILSGLTSLVDGIGSLRTHVGSAHGHNRRSYRVEARHARLAINAAHTLALFILETWEK